MSVTRFVIADRRRPAHRVIQIAGLVARRIVPFAREGETVGAGQRIGMIRFGSRVDVYLPEGARAAGGRGPDRDCRRNRARRPQGGRGRADISRDLRRVNVRRTRRMAGRRGNRYIAAIEVLNWPCQPAATATRGGGGSAASRCARWRRISSRCLRCAPGLTAIRMAFEDRYVLALAAIVFAAILDGIDGRLARFLKGTSRFGAELDSLSDFVNFGVAPALILYFWGLHDLKSAGWIAAMVFAICARLRLARFNVMIEDPDRPAWAGNFFVGVPAPAGAITVLLPIYAVFLGVPRSGCSDLADAVLHAWRRLADGVAAAGIFRQTRRHPRAAGNGRSADRPRGAGDRALDRLSVDIAYGRHAGLSRQPAVRLAVLSRL